MSESAGNQRGEKTSIFSSEMSGSSRTPRHIYGGRRDVPRRYLNSPRLPASSFNRAETAETLPYQPNDSPFWMICLGCENVPGVEDDEEFDENRQLYSSGLSYSRSPLTTNTVHNVRLATPMLQSGVIAMLHQQLALLQKVLQQQEEMKAQQSVLSKKLAKLEDDIHSSSCSSSPV